jgi:cytoskeleton protein RodZ
MPEIGETLREARTRRRIDMGDVEAATKIRAKYLRALENEEWDLLPGPTFVKTFLRTYADYLGLDARLLVEEYRQRYERPSAHELTPFGPGLGGQRRRRRPRAAIGPVLVVVVLLVGLLAALYLLGRWGQGDETAQPPVGPRVTPGPANGAPARVALRLSTPRRMRVCLEDARGRRVLDRATLRAGRATRTFRSRRFRVNFAHGGARMRVNGRTYRAARSGRPVAYEIRPSGRPRRLSAAAGRRLCA